MAIDLTRQRLFVAELGNDSVGVVDLKERRLIRRIAGLREPQGVGYVQTADALYVANARDGSVLLFQDADYSPAGRIDLGDDADNIRVDSTANQVLVGYGNGALAVIDPAKRRKIADIALKGHPESFQLDRVSNRIFANVPDARSIAVVDRIAAKQTASCPRRTPAAISRWHSMRMHSRSLWCFVIPPSSSYSPCEMARPSEAPKRAEIPMTCSWTRNAVASTLAAGMVSWTSSTPKRARTNESRVFRLSPVPERLCLSLN
jgi:hypothetical protein